MIITRHLRKKPIGISRVKLLDEAHFVAWKLRSGARQVLQVFDTDEKNTGVEAGRPHQKRKTKSGSGNGRRRTGRREHPPRQRGYSRNDDTRQALQAFGI